MELLGQDTNSLIVQLNDHGNIIHKMCEMYMSFDFSELDNTSYFYGQLVNYYEPEVDKGKFLTLSSFLNFNKKLSGLIFKGEHNGHRIAEFVGLRPKMYCLIDEKNLVHNAAKGVPWNVIIDGERMSVKNIDMYKSVLEDESRKDEVIEGSFKRINNQGFAISRKEQTKTFMTCTDNKRWILDDNVHTLAFGLINCRTCKDEGLDISLWLGGSKQDSHGSDVWVPIPVRIDPLEHAITRWILDEHGVVHDLPLFTLDSGVSSSMILAQESVKPCSGRPTTSEAAWIPWGLVERSGGREIEDPRQSRPMWGSWGTARQKKRKKVGHQVLRFLPSTSG